MNVWHISAFSDVLRELTPAQLPTLAWVSTILSLLTAIAYLSYSDIYGNEINKTLNILPTS